MVRLRVAPFEESGVLAVGDFVGAGNDDPAIGTPREDVGTEGSEVGDAGEVAVLYREFRSGWMNPGTIDSPEIGTVPEDLALWEDRVFDQGDATGSPGAVEA